MTQFKAGDKVIRIEGEFLETKKGGIYHVIEQHRNNLTLKGLDGEVLGGTYDGDKFALHGFASALTRYRDTIQSDRIEEGDRVEFIDASGEGDSGSIKGDTGVAISVHGTIECQMDSGVTIDVMKHRLRKLAAIEAPKVTLPEITLDEAVKGCQDLHHQIAELQAKAKAFEAVMRKAGIKFI